MPDDVAPRKWASHIHRSLVTLHEPSSMQTTPPDGVFEAKSPIHTAQKSPTTQDFAPDSTYHAKPPSALAAGESIAKPFTRRLMYDPVRDSIASSSPAASSNHTPSDSRPSPPDDTSPTSICHDCNAFHIGADCLAVDARRALHNEGSGSPIRTRIVRQSSRQPDSLTTADQGSQLQYAHSSRASQGAGYADRPSAVYGFSADTGVDKFIQESHERYTSAPSREVGGLRNKRSWAEIDDDIDHRCRKTISRETNGSTCVDVKGKGKAAASQAPAFRLDNLVEPVAQDKLQSSSDSVYERPLAESHASESSVSDPSYVFTGKLPPPPYTGHSTVGSSAHTSIGDLGISVSKDANLDRFAAPDEFERAVFATSGPITTQTSLHGSLRSASSDPGAKLARKHASTSHRRKARGLFPQDNVPLAISTSTTKQSRYRPSGDRQPVACGYKDPITQVQCDEPFNRSVELRRHVRAVHVPAEALAVTMGQLSRSQATLLPADWKPGDGDVLRPKCLCGKEFSRLDALRRHWTGVQAEVVDGKCVYCPSSLGKKKDTPVFEQQGAASTYA